MRIRSRTLVNTANGQADVPVQATLIDLVGHVRPATNIREDAIVNYSEGAVDTIDIVIPYYEGILTGHLVEVYDSINSATAITYYEIVSIADDRNKHQQLSLRCKVAERSILPPPNYAATLVTVGGGGGGGGTINRSTTNLLRFSEDATSAFWTIQTAYASTSATGGTSPSGTNTANLFTEPTTTQPRSIYQFVTSAAGTYTGSIWVKHNAGATRYIRLVVSSGQFDFGYCTVNINAGTFQQTANVSGTATSASATIDSYGSGWYRITLTVTLAASLNFMFVIPMDLASINIPSIDYGRVSYTGTGASFLLWGGQIHTGTTSFGYVPTTTTTASGFTPGGGGGGAGQYVSNSETLQVGTSYAVIIGSGGAGATSGTQQAANGTTSSFIGGTISQSSAGGGGGGSGQSVAYPAQSGGSGGGAGGIVGGTGGTATSGSAGGAAGSPASPWRGAGGGGAGGAGVLGNAGLGTGGGGVSGFAGGGGGGSSNAVGGATTAGGGTGGNSTATGGKNGAANTGGGGGGAGNDTSNSGTSTAGGNGGSGVVTVSYSGSPVATYTGTMTTVTVAGVTTHTLQTSGTFTA